MSTPFRRKSHISHCELLERFDYNPETGLFYPIYPRSVLKSWGTKDKNGYLKGQIKGKDYKVHRLAWFYMTGEIPPGQIDHIDRNRTNNRFNNLRVVTHRENQLNKEYEYGNSLDGFRGVSPVDNGKFRSYVYFNNERIDLGNYSTAEEAHKAYIIGRRLLNSVIRIGGDRHE